MKTFVEGLNVINDPKCNKVLNVITFCPKYNNLFRVITLDLLRYPDCKYRESTDSCKTL